MNTCKYCSSKLSFVGQDKVKKQNHFYCGLCDLTFSQKDICVDRARKPLVPECIDELAYINKSTKELLKDDTITLLHYLKTCRAEWYKMFELLNELYDKRNETNVKEAYRNLHSEYESTTKKRFILENILAERLATVPEKITNNYISEMILGAESHQDKKMYIYINGKHRKGGQNAKIKKSAV